MQSTQSVNCHIYSYREVSINLMILNYRRDEH